MGFILVIVGVVIYMKKTTIDDFYYEVNQKELIEDKIQEGEYSYSRFSEAQERSDSLVLEVIDELASSNSDIGILTSQVMNDDFKKGSGLGKLEEYILRVYASYDIDSFIENAIMVENDLGVSVFSNVVVSQDYMNNDTNMVYFYPLTFVMGSNSYYYNDDDYMTYLAYLKRSVVEFFVAYGMSIEEARERAFRLISFYVDIANHSLKSDDYIEIESYYHPVNLSELMGIYTKFDMEKYLDLRGIVGEEKYSVVDMGQYTYMNEVLIDSNLDVLKDYVFIQILSGYANYLSDEYLDVVIKFQNSLTGGEVDRDEYLKDLKVSLISNLFLEEVNDLYDERIGSLKREEQLLGMVDDIKDYYVDRLLEVDFLSSGTKKKAIQKIENIQVYLGAEKGEDVSSYDIDGNCSFVDNMIVLNREVYLKMLDRLNSDDIRYEVYEYQVNAYYNPLRNIIQVPKSVFYLYDDTSDYYELLGSIGMIIAHEMTHAIDTEGSKFDYLGNMVNWWTDEDRRNFEKRAAKVRDYYSSFEVIEGRYIDGDATLSENIADLGAVHAIVEVARKHGASRDDYKELFTSYAKLWMSQEKEEYLKLLLLQDSHSPNKYRVNAVLSSIDCFYDVYHINYFSDMYRSKDERVMVW